MTSKPRAWIAASAASLGAYALLRAKGVGGRRRAWPPLGQHGPRIVILGAGFAGLTTAQVLRRRLGTRGQIVLVDRHNYHLFTPALYQVASCEVDPYAIAYPIRQFAGRHGVQFRRAMVTGVDFDARRVQLDQGHLEYDHLVIALGTTSNFHGNPGARQHALPLNWLEDGIAIRHHLLDCLEQAVDSANPAVRRELLSFVIIGGGATGVETAGALASMLQQVLPKDYPALDPRDVRVLVIESESKLLGHMGDRIARVTLERLRALGVEVWLNARAKDVESDQVIVDDGRTRGARTILWTTGVRVPAVVAGLDAPHGKGGSLQVDEHLQVSNRPGVYAVGDNAHFEDPRTHQPAPLLAANAIQQGAVVAENVARAVDGLPPRPFRYRDYGNVVSLGHGAGVAEFQGLVVDGLVGWLAWRLVHLVKITSFRNQLATALDWSVGYVYDQDTVRLELDPSVGSASGAESEAAPHA